MDYDNYHDLPAYEVFLGRTEIMSEESLTDPAAGPVHACPTCKGEISLVYGIQHRYVRCNGSATRRPCGFVGRIQVRRSRY